MKTRTKKTAVLSMFLAFLILSQSCRVYDSGSLTVEQALQSKSFVKIRRHDGKPLKYKQIIEEDGKFYGITKKRGKEVRHEIDLNNMKKIKRKNKTWSIIASITGGSAIIFFTFITIALANLDVDFGGGGWSW